MAQREKPGTNVDELCATLGVSREGALVSGGMIEDFREGWAMYVFGNGKVAHYFTRDTQNISQVISACGYGAPVRWMYGRGNIPKCRHCQRQRGEIKRCS